jgi:hypothetical protein
MVLVFNATFNNISEMAWISTPIENISDPLQQDMVKANSGAKKSKFGWMTIKQIVLL